MLRQNALRVELYAEYRSVLMANGHDLSVLCEGVSDQSVRKVAWFNRERVISDDIIGFRQSLEERAIFMTDLVDLAMPDLLRRDDVAALSGADTLMAQANAKDWKIGWSGLY